MADEGAVAVVEAPVVDAGAESFVDEAPAGGKEQAEKPEADKLDGRRQPDALRKRIAGLKAQADAAVDPTEKASLLADAQALTNSVGKVGAYEKVYPTVREAREGKALIESFGGREGLAKAQETLASTQQNDQKLKAGDISLVPQMWKEAPQGMIKLAPAIFSEMEKANPQEYEKTVVPHAVKFFDKSGFPEAFDQMVGLYQAGDKDKGDALALRLAQWFSQQRQGTQQTQKTDPEVERLQRELDERKNGESRQATDRAYNDVVSHAGPVIDKYLKPIVAKLGLSAEQYSALREDTWKHLQDTRNADNTYKTVANAKYAQGLEVATAYIKGETESRAQEAARHVANFRYGHQLKNGVVVKPNATATPITNGITKGKEPSPSEIDYSGKGIAVAKKQGFKDLSDMILAGKAPLKAGGIRQWR
jgi:hypothetical protein